MKYAIVGILAFTCFALTEFQESFAQETANETNKELEADLALLQGTWELLHGNEGKGSPNTRSTKTISGNTETLRRFKIATGEMTREHSVEFELSKSGSVHVFTFYAPGGSSENGVSYVYKVDKNNFFDIPGLLHGDQYRNYQKKPQVWHWKRVDEQQTNDLPSGIDSE